MSAEAPRGPLTTLCTSGPAGENTISISIARHSVMVLRDHSAQRRGEKTNMSLPGAAELQDGNGGLEDEAAWSCPHIVMVLLL